ncbi:MAG TPA: sugar ABC transporter substrate-binding protein [Ilumatobacteraceae bacterium]|nr:sugar ABC transporter substrate-binding protein [Ilumatobacteraceae bacterium]
MKKTRYVFASLAALALLATACGSDDNTSSTAAAPATDGAAATTAAPSDTASADTAAPDTASADTVDVTAGQDVTIAVITHGDGGVFWSVFQKGAEDAGKALGITVKYQGSNNTGTDQAAMINQAVADGVDGLAVSLADPDAVRDAVKAATDAGIPLVTTNSGSDLYKEFGAFTHIGQDEFTAGAGAGEKFNEAGAKVLLCAKQEQTNTGLDARCDGAKSTFKGTFLTPITTSGDASGKQQADMKAAIDSDPTIDAVFGTGPVIAHDAAAAVKELGRTVTVGGVDLSPDLLKDISAGDVLFTIDQQQYLQGYISVVALYLNVTNQNTLGGGLPINTGPGFVTKDTADAVSALVDAGTR